MTLLSVLEAGALLGCSSSEVEDRRLGPTGGVDAGDASAVADAADIANDVFACANGEPWNGASSGYERCESGLVHRITRASCDTADAALMDGGGPPRVVFGELSFGTCTTSADCTQMPFGFCSHVERSAPEPSSATCAYSCTSDADCAGGTVCVCGDGVAECVPASCTSDADCNGFPCYLEFTSFSCGTPSYPQFVCGSSAVACAADSQCGQYESCVHGSCQQRMNTCGRPFLVEGVELRAKVVSRGDWRAEANATIDDLDVNVRRVLGEHWVEMARMEHASIAAFARFTLQLLSLGAPAELLQASQRALADEVEHARLCFGVAGRYLGADVGPGPLPIDGALADLEVVSVFRATFFEACVEETCSALEVAEAAERATDPTLRAVLSRIAEDEARHGELGWSTTQWLLRAVPSDRRAALHSELRDHVMAALRDAQRQSTTTSLDDRVVAHGMLQASTRRALRLAALADVVLPCLSRLFDGVGTSAAA